MDPIRILIHNAARNSRYRNRYIGSYLSGHDDPWQTALGLNIGPVVEAVLGRAGAAVAAGVGAARPPSNTTTTTRPTTPATAPTTTTTNLAGKY